MNIAHLKSRILDLAVRGKLTEQRPEDGSAAELLARVREEKQRLIAEGKIKKEKPLPEITEDEKPFNIPAGWEWCRLGEICEVLGDGIHGTPEYDESGKYCFINGNNLFKGKIIIKSNTKKVSQTEYEKYRKNLNENTILISINGTIGNYAFYKNEPVILGKSACYFSLMNDIDKKYICSLFNTSYFSGYVEERSTQTTIKNLSLETMRLLSVPLPPLAEQKRIVEKIEQLFRQADIIEQNRLALKTRIRQTRSRVLDLAVRGKLTEQRPEDGSAAELLARVREEKQRLIATGKIKKEKPLPEITEDEKPFNIPASWEWCRLPELCTIPITDGTHQTPVYSDKENGIPFLSSKDVTSQKIDWSRIKYITKDLHEILYKRIAPQKYDVLLAKNGTTGVAALVEDDIVFDIYVTLAVLRPDQTIIYPQFLLQVINSPVCKKQFDSHLLGIGVPNLHLYEINKTLIPLPPLTEQKRIVEKIEQIFTALDIIEKTVE